MQTRQRLRACAAQFISRVPDFRGRNKLAYVANRLLLNSSASTEEVAMRLGHRMIVDLRAYTEYASFYTHDFDTEEIRSVVRMFAPEWVILDVGANVGFWTIPMAKALGAGVKRCTHSSRLPATICGCARTSDSMGWSRRWWRSLELKGCPTAALRCRSACARTLLLAPAPAMQPLLSTTAMAASSAEWSRSTRSMRYFRRSI